MSVPNQYSRRRGLQARCIGATACGSTVPSHGAKIAMRIMTTSTTAPAIAVGWRRSASLRRRQVGDVERGGAERELGHQ